MTFPAGTYWIGDLVHVLSSDEFDKVLDEISFCDDDMREFVSPYIHLNQNKIVAAFNTKVPFNSAKKVLTDQNKFNYTIKSNTIGCINIEHLNGNISEYGSLVKYSKKFDVYFDKGVIQFGKIKIRLYSIKEIEYDDCHDDFDVTLGF